MSNRCFWCSTEGVQHRDPSEPACLGSYEETVIDAGLEKALQEIAERGTDGND
jgi:hypothetical protein